MTDKPYITHKEWLDYQSHKRLESRTEENKRAEEICIELLKINGVDPENNQGWIKARFNKNYVSSGDVFEVSKEITRIKKDEYKTAVEMKLRQLDAQLDVARATQDIIKIKQDNTTKINLDWLTNPNAERKIGNKRPLKAIRNDFDCLNTCPECGAKQHD